MINNLLIIRPTIIKGTAKPIEQKDNNITPFTLSLIATANTDPKIGPIHGLQPKANATPIKKGKKWLF